MDEFTNGSTTEDALQGLEFRLDDLTDAERADVLRGINEAYDRFVDATEVQELERVLPLFTDDYALIFPRSRNQPVWDKARVERDVRRCGPQPRGGHTRIRAVVDELLAVERDSATGRIREATVRATFIDAGGRDQPPHARIDTFAFVGTEWKMRRTLALGPESK
jgi:hypothetical protein